VLAGGRRDIVRAVGCRRTGGWMVWPPRHGATGGARPAARFDSFGSPAPGWLGSGSQTHPRAGNNPSPTNPGGSDPNDVSAAAAAPRAESPQPDVRPRGSAPGWAAARESANGPRPSCAPWRSRPSSAPDIPRNAGHPPPGEALQAERIRDRKLTAAGRPGTPPRIPASDPHQSPGRSVSKSLAGSEPSPTPSAAVSPEHSGSGNGLSIGRRLYLVRRATVAEEARPDPLSPVRRAL